MHGQPPFNGVLMLGQFCSQRGFADAGQGDRIKRARLCRTRLQEGKTGVAGRASDQVRTVQVPRGT
ncbi:MAG: hypothetical protein ABI771_08795 [Betaproteobacteria bacterium]